MLTDMLGIVEPQEEISDLEQAGWNITSSSANRFNLARADPNLQYLDILRIHFSESGVEEMELRRSDREKTKLLAFRDLSMNLFRYFVYNPDNYF